MERSKIRVRERRTYYGYSQRELAQMVGITSGAMSAIERGVHLPVADTAIRIARALDTTVEELWGDGVEDSCKKDGTHTSRERAPERDAMPGKERRKR